MNFLLETDNKKTHKEHVQYREKKGRGDVTDNYDTDPEFGFWALHHTQFS